MPKADKTQTPVGEVLIPGALDQHAPPGKSAQPPCAAIAAGLLKQAKPGATCVYVASSDRRAEEIGRALFGFAPTIEVLVLPPWDCLPYDRASPSRDIMGRRMAVLGALAKAAAGPRIVVVSPEALIQKLPPKSAVEDAGFALEVGDRLDRDALAAFCHRTGYVFDDRIDEPGEIAVLGAVVDIFPAEAALPVRIVLSDDDVIEEIRPYDPLSQRTIDRQDGLQLGPASELILPIEAAEPSSQGDEGVEPGTNAPGERRPGVEHGLAAAYDSLRSLFDLIPEATAGLDPKAQRRLEEADAHIKEALEARQALAADDTVSRGLYLELEAVQAGLGRWGRLEDVAGAVRAIDAIDRLRASGKAVAERVAAEHAAGRSVVLAGLAHELKLMRRALLRSGSKPTAVADWDQARAAPRPSLLALEADIDTGFIDEADALTLISASDVFGGRIAAGRADPVRSLDIHQDLALGDVVLHEDHGLAVLKDVVAIEVDGLPRDTLQLEYRGGDSLLVPIDEIDKVWRYGAEATTVTLDRLKGDAWNKRRAEASVQIDEAARALTLLAKKKAARTCDPVIPPKAALERFSARFPYPETEDQSRAIEDVLDDLACGRPMDRLICADVGYGKTEVALRAAAAVALSGRQVMVAAPTTVLARQHFEVFTRRFAEFGVGVAQLSRLVASAEAKAVRAQLASGEVKVVVGTHALGSEEVSFDDLGLVIIDEEQKFGAVLKDQLRAMAEDGHILTLTATPIPRTLQAAAVGLQAVSVIATPPARRRPVRTFLAPFDEASLRTALHRERRRGGQSFVVVPRIDDLEPLRALLTRHAPDLVVRMAHGEMPAEEADRQMVSFADGDGDVLLATNIIESGLDVPRANTIVIWRPDLFGLAQLHQLRGRVGRGRAQGVAYLLTDEAEPLSDAARSRLSTLEAFDRLGSGLAISARDLDIRGGGDLIGDDQAGHMKLIGSALYQRLMDRALRTARGEPVEDATAPQIRLDGPQMIPADYCPDPVIRLNLYARLAKLEDLRAIDAFEEEVVDRLGVAPPSVNRWLASARLRALARAARVSRVSVGPKGAALDLEPVRRKDPLKAVGKIDPDAQLKADRLVLSGDFVAEDNATILEQVLEALRV